jgi:hypothetical protein
MTSELSSMDISALPELVRLAEEVARTRRPRTLRRGSEAVAVLAPTPAQSRRSRSARPSRDTRSIAERTAGSLKRYAKQPPATREEEKNAFGQAVAEEVASGAGT